MVNGNNTNGMDKVTIYYLIVNDKGQPLYSPKTGQIFIYISLDDALIKVKKDMKKDWLAKRTRIVIRKAIFACI